MRRTSLNLSALTFCLLLALLPAGQGCRSKRLAKQAEKLEDAGLYEMAAENYFRSFNANPKNIEAATGLRRTGQRTLEAKAALVNHAWLSGDERETVYKYLDALAYQERIESTGIDLSMPDMARSSYEEAKPRFLERSFTEARLLLEEENFYQAESLFSEIKRIDPLYQDLDRYIRISRSEPLYREGVEELNSGFYRKAYNTFSELLSEYGAYKDAKELREDALSRGMITIAIADFENRTRQRNAHNIIKSLIIKEINSLNNPFLQVVDDRNINAFLKEQELAAKLGSEMKIGQLMAAKALLTGRLISFEIREGRLQQNEIRGYLKEVITHEDKETGDKTTETIYHKVTWYEYTRENSASASFDYRLSSTETGAVLTSGIIELSPGDRIHYAQFEGETANLVPGHWEYRNRDSGKDIIRDQRRYVRELQSLFSARQNIKPAEALRSELNEGIAMAVSQAVNAYNPEQ